MTMMLRRTFLLASAIGTSAVAMPASPLRVLAYGDSNTWGLQPSHDGQDLPRYADSVRWSGVLQRALAGECQVMANGVLARTFNSDLQKGIAGLSGEDHNGIKRLPLALLAESPVHLVVVMLGTNDMMAKLDRSLGDIAAGVQQYADAVAQATDEHAKVRGPRLLLVAPPPLGAVERGVFSDTFNAESVRKSEQLGKTLAGAARTASIAFLDAGTLITIDGNDGVHLSASAHRTLGLGIAKAVRPLIHLSTRPKSEA
jgi:lysophospholipase L1-like esterase